MATTTSPQTMYAARAVQATKVYGSGDNAVRALDNVSAEFAHAQFTAIMGPSGSGKSTLLHCQAGLDWLTSGQVFLGDLDLSRLSDQELTKVRRDRVGFVFQTFNLIPTLTARENVELPLSLAGRKPDEEWFDRIVDTVRLRDRFHIAPRSSRGASSSAWRWRAPLLRGPRSSSPTSRPATSIPVRATRSSGS